MGRSSGYSHHHRYISRVDAWEDMEAHSLANRDEPLPTLAAAPVDSSASSATFGENSSSNDNTHMGTRNFSGRLFDTYV